MLGDIKLFNSQMQSGQKGSYHADMRVSVVVDLTLYTFMYRGLPGKGLTAVFFLYVHTSGADPEMGEEGAQNGDCYRYISCILAARFPNRFLL